MRFIFLDLDDTILDFHRAERQALSQTLRHFHVDPTDAVLDRYHVLNRRQWELLEEGKLTRPQVLVRRFQLLFDELGIRAAPQEVCQLYEEQLAQGHFFVPGAQELLEALHTRYELYLALPRSRTAGSRAQASPAISKTSSSPNRWGPISPARPSSTPALRRSRTLMRRRP